MNRNDKILAALDRSMRVLEIGPLATPIVPKSEGWRTSVVDHATRDALVEKYASDPNVDTSRIEEVDVVWSDGPLHESVPRESHGTFDACIASHALEHIPDPIGLLTSLERVLAPESFVSLVIPDKRYCFDYYKPLSSVGELLEANARGASRHSRKARFDHEAYSVRADGEFAWSRRRVTEIEFFSNLANAKRGFDSHGTRPEDAYVDVHGWHFTPSSFALAILELAALDVIDFSIERSFPTEGCEFYVTLGRGRAVLTPEELQRRRLELLGQTLDEVRDQAELLLGPAMAAPGPTRSRRRLVEVAKPIVPHRARRYLRHRLARRRHAVSTARRVETTPVTAGTPAPASAAPSTVGDALPLPPLELMDRVGRVSHEPDPVGEYLRLGRGMRDIVLSLLPGDFSLEGRRILDFGCGAGRVLRHFVANGDPGEYWGCDIDEPSIAWLQRNLSPAVQSFACAEKPSLPVQDDFFGLVYAISVFTHITTEWSAWLLEMHRVLTDDGLLLATFLGEGMQEMAGDERWDEDLVGMRWEALGNPWDQGGPLTFLSPWWIRAHWGRAFDILALYPHTGALHTMSASARAVPQGHGIVVLRKRPGSFSTDDLERFSADEPREGPAMWAALRRLHDECLELRMRLDR